MHSVATCLCVWDKHIYRSFGGNLLIFALGDIYSTGVLQDVYSRTLTLQQGRAERGSCGRQTPNRFAYVRSASFQSMYVSLVFPPERFYVVGLGPQMYMNIMFREGGGRASMPLTSFLQEVSAGRVCRADHSNMYMLGTSLLCF